MKYAEYRPLPNIVLYLERYPFCQLYILSVLHLSLFSHSSLLGAWLFFKGFLFLSFVRDSTGRRLTRSSLRTLILYYDHIFLSVLYETNFIEKRNLISDTMALDPAYWKRTIVAVSLTFGILATIIYLLRVYATRRVSRRVTLDEVIMGCAVLVMWAHETCVLISMYSIRCALYQMVAVKLTRNRNVEWAWCSRR